MATSFGFGQFSRRMEFRAKELDANSNKLMRKIGLVADQAIVLSTPVDTGTARSNWRLSLVTPAEGVIDAYSPGSRLGAGEGANAQAAISQALSVLAQRVAGQPIVITNNLPYIESLNSGSSRQAPAGFVDTAVAQAASALSAVRIFPSA